MAGREFRTVPDELLEHANAAATFHEEHGYSVKVERKEPAFPYRPTLLCKRAPTTLVIEVVESVELDRAREWSRFGHSLTRDTRFAFAVPASNNRNHDIDAALAELGVGLLVVDGDTVLETLPAKDLAVNLDFPELRRLSPKLRKLLAPAYEQFQRSQWREAFNEMCQVLEKECLAHLKKGVNSGRVTFRRPNGRVWKLTVAQIDKMPMGGLAQAFSLIETPNHADTVAATTLTKINKDRIAVTHKKGTAATEARLRRNAGQDIWLVVSALKEIC